MFRSGISHPSTILFTASISISLSCPDLLITHFYYNQSFQSTMVHSHFGCICLSKLQIDPAPKKEKGRPDSVGFCKHISLLYKCFIYCLNCSLEILFLYSNDNIHFAGSLVNHSDIYSCFCQGSEQSCGSTLPSRHSCTYSGDK